MWRNDGFWLLSPNVHYSDEYSSVTGVISLQDGLCYALVFLQHRENIHCHSSQIVFLLSKQQDIFCCLSHLDILFLFSSHIPYSSTECCSTLASFLIVYMTLEGIYDHLRRHVVQSEDSITCSELDWTNLLDNVFNWFNLSSKFCAEPLHPFDSI